MVAAALYDALCHADDADLYYVVDNRPGITRRKRGTGFSYHHPGGAIVAPADRKRIEELVIPPAWTDVWICPLPDGHIQATGRDARGRKQYRYHDRWREVRDGNKYDRMATFGAGLPDLRAKVEHDLAARGLGRDRVLAAVVQLLDQTLIRVGNDRYAEENESFGLTTLQADHAEIDGSLVRFEFRGKSGVDQDVALRDRRLAAIVRQCQELPGEDLFGYLDDDGEPVDVTSTMVNDYLRDRAGDDVTAKHFRTWGGTVTVAEMLAPLPVPDDEKEAKSNELAALDAAAGALGNTRTVCRNCYVHPRLAEAYRAGELEDVWKRARARRHFSRAESAVLSLLQASSSGQ